MEKSSFPEQWLQAFGKFSLDFFVIELGSPLKVLYRGGKASSYFGYPAESFIALIQGRPIDIILDSYKTHVAETMLEAIQTKADMDLSFQLTNLDSSVSMVHVMGTYLYCLEDIPVYLFLLQEQKKGQHIPDQDLEHLRIRFSADTGSLIEANPEGSIAFSIHEFSNTYEAISTFVSRYVHPQDRNAFTSFADRKALGFFGDTKKELGFRRQSYDKKFSGYRWSLLSFLLLPDGPKAEVVCEILIQDFTKAESILANKTLQTQLDPLTGVLNRAALELQVDKQISLCSEKPCMGALFMLDIDHFKWVNDTFGHDKGDYVLLQVAEAVSAVFRPTDIVARPGGDEFAIFITGIPSKALAITKAEQICLALRSLDTSLEGLRLSCSVGVSIFPEHGTSFKELYHTSDLALYQAKRGGRDNYCLFGTNAMQPSKERPIDREWLFSQMEEEIYLCNIDTYTLLFANETLLLRIGVSTFRDKARCYEVLHQRSTPCEKCQNLCLETSGKGTWVRVDKKLNTRFFVREKIVLLQGERVKLSVASPLPQDLGGFLYET